MVSAASAVARLACTPVRMPRLAPSGSSTSANSPAGESSAALRSASAFGEPLIRSSA